MTDQPTEQPTSPQSQAPPPAQAPSAPPAAQGPRGEVTEAVASNYDPQPTAHQERLTEAAEEIAVERQRRAAELRQIGEKVEGTK